MVDAAVVTAAIGGVAVVSELFYCAGPCATSCEVVALLLALVVLRSLEASIIYSISDVISWSLDVLYRCAPLCALLLDPYC